MLFAIKVLRDHYDTVGDKSPATLTAWDKKPPLFSRRSTISPRRIPLFVELVNRIAHVGLAVPSFIALIKRVELDDTDDSVAKLLEVHLDAIRIQGDIFAYELHLYWLVV